MKKISLLLVLIILSFASAFAQGVPQGMKYQAVARNLVGSVIPNQEISLKISLLTQGTGASVYYAEVHTVTTSPLGLFTLVVGEGKVEKGSFKDIPWSTEDVWMQVALKDKGKSDFVTISNSKLFAVPYAFHAATAGELVSNSRGANQRVALSTATIQGTSLTTTTTSGTTASMGNSWNTGGNLGTDAGQYLGTADNAALVVRTNNQTRFIFLKDGNDTLYRTLSIGANLNVDSSVTLNKTNGSTLNNGPLTVGTTSRRSPTSLFGTLTVDTAQATKLGGTLVVDKATQLNSSLTVNGPTDLNSRLNVNRKSATTLTGTLNVKGITDLDSALNVNGKNPTVLTGSLRVDSNAVFNSPTNSDTSLASPNGALAIFGGVGIAKNLSIGGDVRIGGHTTLAGPLKITDPTESINDSTGAVTVSGGVGIGKNLNVGGNANIIGSTNIGGSATVAGATTINNVLNVNAGAGQVSIIGASGGGTDGSESAYPLVVSGNSQGVMVKITGTTQASSANNFVTFQDGSQIRGRIEGQTQDDLENEEQYKHDVMQLDIAVATAAAQEVMAGATLIGALTAAAPCVGLGVCVVTPPVSPAVAAAANLIVSTARLAATVYGLESYKSRRSEKIGVTYASNGADYAEWLPRLNKGDHLMAGEVVGVKNGFISRSTKNAEKIMVISTNPIVLGNMGHAEGAEKVAFMGQVPVRVFGKVEIGDYIIATGDDNGFGTAKHQQDLTANDYQQLVGIAWSSSQGTSASIINVAVGLANGTNKMMQKQDEKIASLTSELNSLKAQVNKTNELLAKLVSGNKNSIALNEIPVVSTPIGTTLSNVSTATINSRVADVSNDGDSRWIYNRLTDSELEEGLKLAQQMLSDKGVNVEQDPVFKKLRTDAGYKATFMAKLKENFDKNAARIKQADKIVVTK